MLVIRLIFVFFIITAMVLLGLHLLLDDKKYLHYFKQTLKYSLFLGIAPVILTVSRRVINI